MLKHAAQTTSVESDKAGEVETHADLLIHYLLQVGVDYIFGVPGGAIEPLYDAISRNLRQPFDPDSRTSSSTSLLPARRRNRPGQIQSIVARHEAGAAFMADGYARETGKIGVCCATTGPGATNLLTGVAAAYADQIPMLVITAQTALPNFGRLGFQESSSDAIDIVGMFEHCTRYNSLVSHPDQLEGKLYKALLHAFRLPRGPVHLSIPMDIFKAPRRADTAMHQVAHLFRRSKTVDGESYQALLAAVQQARKKVLFIGDGCKDAMDAVVAFAERTNTPIVTTPAAKGMINNYHPLYRGVFGFAGHESAYKTVQEKGVELIMAVGTPLGEMCSGGWDKGVLNNRLVHLSATESDFNGSPMARLHVLGDLPTLFNSLNRDIPVSGSASRISIVAKPEEVGKGACPSAHHPLPGGLALLREEQLFSTAVPIKPQRVMYELMQKLPADTRFIVDTGNAWAWATHYLMLTSVGLQRTSFSFGAMGWAIGAAVGTALGGGNRPVVCITGDGSYLMSGQEISVAVAERLPVLFIVLNDQALGMVKHGQRMTGAESIGCTLPVVDFAQIARAQGARAYTIRTADDFEQLEWTGLLVAGGPTLLDIQIDPEEPPPLDARIKTLRNADARML